MKRTTAFLSIVVVLTTGLIMAAQPARPQPPSPPRPGREQPDHATVSTPVRPYARGLPTTYPADDNLPLAAEQRTRVQVEVFYLQCPTEALDKIDPAKLTTGSYADITGRLKEVGEGRLLHRMDIPMQLSRTTEASINVGSTVPVVTDLTITGNGTVTPSVCYKDTGCGFEIKGAWLADGSGADVLVNLRWSDIVPGNVEIGGGVKLPIFGQFKFSQTLRLKSGKPVAYVVSQAGNPTEPEPKARAGIVRFTLTHVVD